MSPGSVRAVAFGIGVAAGLRPLVPPAVLAWTAHSEFAGRGSPLAALISRPASRKMIKLAAGELLADKLPFTPDRIRPGPLATRLACGAACGAALTFLIKRSPKEGALWGSAGALAGTFGGYYARKTLSRKRSGLGVAIAEDALAIALTLGIVRHVTRTA